VYAAKITPVFVFQSTNEVIRRNQGEFPWSRNLTFVGDPEKTIYRATGTETSLWKILMSIKQAFSKDFVFVCMTATKLNSIVIKEQGQRR
jgi:hypothetical protein